MKRLKWGMDTGHSHSEEKLLYRSVQSWRTETLKYIWRANSISVGLFWWYSPSTPGLAHGSVHKQACAGCFSRILNRQLRMCLTWVFPGDQVTSFEMRLWLPLFGSAWAECRRGVFFCPRSCSVSAQLSCFTYGLAQATGRGCGQAEINNALPMHTVWMLVHTVWMLVHPLSHCSAPYCAALLPDTRAALGNYRSVTR